MLGMSRRVVAAGLCALALAVGAGGPGSAVGAEEDKGPNTGRVSLSVGTDWTTDYYFRGIVQETEDFILQPYGSVTFKLWDGETGVTAVNLALGIWNSLHWGPTGQDSSTTVDPRLWYELDFYVSLSVELFKALTFSTTYTAYTSPNDGFGTVQEVAFGLALNDARWLGPFALNPSVLVAVETEGQADIGRHRGVYMQIGVAPGVTLFAEGAVPVTLTFPLAVGLSLSDYYEFGRGHDSTFGYFSAAGTVSVPLTFIPAAFGAWEARGGVQFLVLADNLKRANAGDGFEAIGTLGLAMKY
jgi:hypothetical protein